MDWMVSIAVRRSLMGLHSSPAVPWVSRLCNEVFAADILAAGMRRSRLLHNSRQFASSSSVGPSDRGKVQMFNSQRNLFRPQRHYLQTADVKRTDSSAENVDLIVQQSGDLARLRQSSQALISDLGDRALEDIRSSDLVEPGIRQGSKEWFALRENRITASSFGSCLGIWDIRRTELWEEKIGLRESFTGNSATRWGTLQEPIAVERYKEITGNTVDHMAFKIYYPEDEYLSWLGASPDGIITYAPGNRDPHAAGEKSGILEVKCPHNKGSPERGTPWGSVPYYYIPQAQGLLEIFDRSCMDFYVWTTNGSSVFRIERDPEYWAIMFQMISEFWWGNVIPAKCALKMGKTSAEVQAFRPVQSHPALGEIISMSKHIALNSRLIWRETRGNVVKL